MSLYRIIALISVLILLAWQNTAEAAKAKFERSKPHVNVGTTGSYGPGEGAVASLRLFAPSLNENEMPPCSFQGIAVLSTNTPGRGLRESTQAVDAFREEFTIDVMLDDPKDLLRIPFNVEAQADKRLSYLFEVLSNDSNSMDQCGLDIVIELYDLQTGMTVGTETPVHNQYRPQSYIRTPTE
jgi:hypothetical protein